MYPSVRTTLKARHQNQGRRHTLKNQKGGAPWEYIGPSRKDMWSRVLPEDLKFVLNAGFLGTETNSVQNYITIVERQDELFVCALKAIYNTLGLPESPTEEQIIAASKETNETNKASLIEYIYDVYRLIRFTDPTSSPGPDARQKVAQIKNEPLTDLLLNPMRVQNRFIQDLAAICIQQKQDPTILSILTTDLLKTTRAKRYNASIQVNAYETTSVESRDGFYVSQQISEFKAACNVNKTTENKTPSFWEDFVTSSVTSPTIPDNLRQLPYGILAGYIFNKYKESSVADLKQTVLTGLARKEESSIFTEEKKEKDPSLPDWVELSKEILLGLPLLKVLQNMDLTQLQFITHLIATIQKNEASVLASLRGSTAVSSSPAEEQPTTTTTTVPPSPAEEQSTSETSK
jgi:hypothetical protein